REAQYRLGEEHQPEIADHRVESFVRERESLCVIDQNGSIARFAEALARLLGHCRGDIGGRNVTGRADRGEGCLGRKPRASSDVKDAHTLCTGGRAQKESHELSRNWRKGSVFLGRRPPRKEEFRHTFTL